ncbi:MAG: type II toxin-antitoxin system HigB family toxin [Anaerolineaceae bacterium]|nr:type II toxin-antitoxin system HigB family toxin [Anaerolineaceae bacterium]
MLLFLVTILVTLCYDLLMRIISRRILREFWEKHPDASVPLQAWFRDVEQANWKTPADIKAIHKNASFVAKNRVVFNIKGNHYRIVVVVVYQHGVVYIRFVGTHSEYDMIDVTTI